MIVDNIGCGMKLRDHAAVPLINFCTRAFQVTCSTFTELLYTISSQICMRRIAVLQHAGDTLRYYSLSFSCCSGALDVSEDVAVAVGLPHVSRIWEEIHRVHHHRNSPLIHSSESCPTSLIILWHFGSQNGVQNGLTF